MIRFNVRNLPRVNLKWWPPTQRQWAPILLEQQKPFWKREREPTMNTPWAKLSPNYKIQKDKKYPGEPILRATGAMQDTAKILPGSNGGFKAETLKYGAYHQFGTRKMPARPWLGIPPSSLASLGVIAIKNIFFRRNRN